MFKKFAKSPTLLGIIFLWLAATTTVYGLEGIPNYELQFLGPGAPTAINNHGVIVGAKTNANNYEPLVSVDGNPWTTLPVPGRAVSVFPTDVNDQGVIVGVAYSLSGVPSAVRWLPGRTGYTAEVLPMLPGDTAAYATSINNLGQIVGARNALGYTPTGSGWLLSEGSGLVDLGTQYDFWVVPAGINDSAIIIGGQEQLDLNSGVIKITGAGPSNYNPVTSLAINNAGLMVGSATLRSISLNVVSVFRYDANADWGFIAGSSKYTRAGSINLRGDIGYSELGAALYLEGLGSYALSNLLDPALLSAGWAISDGLPQINDQRIVAVTARNQKTGQAGGVVLTPNGTVQPPSAPINLRGVAHSATRMEPYNSINLSWENTSPLTQSYQLERREANNGNWGQLSLTPPGTATNHSDTTVGVGIVYEYRVRAMGIAGGSPWSAIVTVTSPTTSLDSTPPVVTIAKPSSGDTVSGRVDIVARASDNRAVTYLEMSYWNQYQGKQVILGSVDNSGKLSVTWNTRGLTPATYTLKAYATDAVGNWAQTEISVKVEKRGLFNK
jgi:hypothetical protein